LATADLTSAIASLLQQGCHQFVKDDAESSERGRGGVYEACPMDKDGKNAPSATEERIRTRAYMIWEHEGRPDGCALAHWVLATEMVEREDRESPESRARKEKASSRK
jgi:hypothetical protein